MHQRSVAFVCALGLLAGPTLSAAQARDSAQVAPAPVPSDLRPLLTPRQSEFRLAVTRYNADRALLSGNFAGAVTGGQGRRGGGPGGPPDNAGGRAGAAPNATAGLPDTTIAISTRRIARLKRFDLSWQTALAAIDANGLSAQARNDLDQLKNTVAKNLAQLDAETAALSDVLPLLPFAPALVDIIEARLRFRDVDAQATAGLLTELTREIKATSTALSSGLSGSGGVRASRRQAIAAASAVNTLRANLATWFNFYNGYDPLFTWWVNLPYKHINEALDSYATLLREKVAPADAASSITAVALRIEPAPRPPQNEVPDLAEIIALPQDEMTDIVARFRGVGAGAPGGGRGGGRGGPPPAREPGYYRDWLKALETLDFDRLSRNAQVDYLYLKKLAELQVERAGKPLPANPPRKQDNSGITGPARGREGLIRDLQDELIPYTPEQLIALAEREFAWSEAEMIKASREMGLGDDWKAAVEKTKTMHVPPGQQPAMIRDLVFEAIEFLRTRDIITIPQVAAESQRMSMMSPERQLTSPFFLGGAQIQVSYPTNEMEYDARMQSMRGNNRPWSHATAYHELIPGHNLTGYYNQRYANYRANLGAGGPFFGEGWALYWEFMMWDMGFNDTPEERVGALVWRMHRSARIVFSLNFHMGKWSPQECIDYLVDRVGHERDNATAEVRRSFDGSYGPLYQAAYMLGGLQLRGLRRELVDSGQMTERAFHDEILRQGSMPIALLRLALGKQRLTRDMSIDWKFYGELPDR
jgi:hypothetical protein